MQLGIQKSKLFLAVPLTFQTHCSPPPKDSAPLEWILGQFSNRKLDWVWKSLDKSAVGHAIGHSKVQVISWFLYNAAIVARIVPRKPLFSWFFNTAAIAARIVPRKPLFSWRSLSYLVFRDSNLSHLTETTSRF